MKPFSDNSFFDMFKKKEDDEDPIVRAAKEFKAPSVTTSEEFRPQERARLSDIVEGGLLAARNEEVPEELAAGIRRPEVVDRTAVTNVFGEGSPESVSGKVAAGARRFAEGVRRSPEIIAEGRAKMLGLDAGTRSMRPQLAVEDTRRVAEADSLLESGIDLAGEIAPEAVSSIGIGQATGAARAIAEGLAGVGGSAAKQVAARTAADVGLGLTENFYSAGRVPTPQAAGAIGGFSLFFQAVPGGARFASRVVSDGAFGENTARLWRGVFRTGDQHAVEIFDAVGRHVERNQKRATGRPWSDAESDLVTEWYGKGNNQTLTDLTGRSPAAVRGKAQRVGVVEPRAPRAQEAPVPTEAERIASEVAAEPGLVDDVTRFSDGSIVGQSAPQDSRLLSGGGSFRELEAEAAAKGLKLELGEGTDLLVNGQPVRNFKEAAALIREAPTEVEQKIANSIAHTDDALEITKGALRHAKTDDDLVELAGRVADLPDPKAREKFVRGLNDAENVGEVMSGFDPVKLAREAYEFDIGSKYKEFYINALLTNPGTHMVNFVSNTVQMPLRTAVMAGEAAIGLPVRGLKRFGLEPTPGGFFDEAAGRTFSDVGQAMRGYATGAKMFWDIWGEVGNNARLRSALRSGIGEVEGIGAPGHIDLTGMSGPERDALANIVRVENEGFLAALMDRYAALKGVFFSDAGDEFTAGLNRALEQRAGAEVRLGGLAADVAQGAQGAIGGRKGSFLRGPTQALQTSDTLFKSMFWNAEYNFAKKRLMNKYGLDADMLFRPESHLTPDELTRKHEMLNEAADLATKNARYNTFTSELGTVGKRFNDFRLALDNKLLPVGTLLSPFVNTPVNILKYTGRHTPVGAIKVGYDAIFNTGAYQAGEMVQRVAESAVGTTLMAGTMYLINSGVIEIEGTVNQGAEARTREAAAGGQRRNYSLKTSDGTRIPLNRGGPLGLIVGASGDAYYRMETMVKAKLEEAEQDLNRGGITQEEFEAIKEQAVNDAFFEKLGLIMGGEEGYKELFTFGAGAGASVLANNIYNETALADAVDFLVKWSRATESQDFDAIAQLSSELEQRVATALQPVAAINSAAQAISPEPIQPDPEAGFTGRVGTRWKERVPGLDTGEGFAQRDIFGQVRRNRFTGDTSETQAGRILGKLFSPFGGGVPEFIGDAERDKATLMAQELVKLEVYKDFPRVPAKQREKFGTLPGHVQEQIQAFRGKERFKALSGLFDHPDYQSISNVEQKAEVVDRFLRQADTRSAEIVDAAMAQAVAQGQEPNINILVDEYGMDIPRFERQEESQGFFERFRRQ